jgi:GalNAc-alpha-(1->4)-GalNAc-alpha-(1->3)-diNAcBac-PP-undecaprenol alpha-1,4-N-acetyl-D-galactosaminyltransferase
LKILFVISSLKTGGAEHVLVMLANYLSQQSNEVIILKFSEQKPFFELNDKVKVLTINKIQNKIPFISRVLNLKNHFKKINPDIIISFTTTINVYSIIASKLSRYKIIVSEHTNFHRAKSYIWKILRKIFYPFADLTIVLTKYDKKLYSNYLKQVEVIKNPLVLQNKYNNLNKEKIILAVGRLHNVKGFDMLIEAFANIKNKGSWKLIILGEGEERLYLEEKIKKYNCDESIVLKGNIKDVEFYYKTASIFVLSSRAEGFPGSLCEAMGYGCPSIAFNCITGPNEIITHNKNGILVPPNDIYKLQEQIEILMNNEDLRKSLGSESKKIASELNITKIASIWLKKIKEVI